MTNTKTHKKPLIPQLRFKEFDGEWENEEFGELVTRSKAKYNPAKDVESLPCIELECLSQETGELLKIFDSLEQKSIKNRFAKGDILFGKLRPYLRKFLKAPFEGVCSSEIWVLRGSELENEYLYQLIQTHKFNLEINITSGSKMPRAEWDYISNVKFKFPSLKEQQKIATFLTAVDDKISQLTRKKEHLTQYKKGVMQQLFSQELRFQPDGSTTSLRGTQQRSNLPDENSPSASNENQFPDWEEKRFEEIFSFYSTNSYSRDNLNYDSGLVKNIHYGDIHTKFSMLFDLEKEIVPFINTEINLEKIKDENYCCEGDLVIADASEDYNDIGKSIEIVNLNNEIVLAGLHTFLARPKELNMFNGFSGYMMQSWNARKQIMTIAQGTKVLGLATSRLGKIKLQIPSLKEQQKIASYLCTLDDKIEAVQVQIEQTQVFKKGLLQQLFV